MVCEAPKSDTIWLDSTQNLASRRSVHNRCSALRLDASVFGRNGRIAVKVSNASLTPKIFSWEAPGRDQNRAYVA